MNIIEREKDNYLSKIACDKSMSERIEITEENCDGYAELFKLRYANEEQNELYKKHLIGGISGILIMLPSFVFPSKSLLFIGILAGYEVIITAGMIIKNNKIDKKRKQEFREKYPDINLKTDIVELRQSLSECGILTTKYVNGSTTWDINVDNFKSQKILLELFKVDTDKLPDPEKESVAARLKETYEQLPEQSKVYFWASNYETLLEQNEFSHAKNISDAMQNDYSSDSYDIISKGRKRTLKKDDN